MTQGLWKHFLRINTWAIFKPLCHWAFNFVYLEFSSPHTSLPSLWLGTYLPFKTQAPIISSLAGLLEVNSPLPSWQQLPYTSLKHSEDAAWSLACVSIPQLYLFTLVPRSLSLSQTLPTLLWISLRTSWLSAGEDITQGPVAGVSLGGSS